MPRVLDYITKNEYAIQHQHQQQTLAVLPAKHTKPSASSTLHKTAALKNQNYHHTRSPAYSYNNQCEVWRPYSVLYPDSSVSGAIVSTLQIHSGMYSPIASSPQFSSSTGCTCTSGRGICVSTFRLRIVLGSGTATLRPKANVLLKQQRHLH